MMIHPQCWPRAPTSKIRPCSSNQSGPKRMITSSINKYAQSLNYVTSVCRGGVVVRASDLQLRRFEFRPLRFTNDPGQVVHTHTRASVHQAV